ncbi:Survival protein SurE-like phosphatase/nucleotidase [Kalmanozyma brasiliensis GHG001]|uniref:Survival protein SurE-like phosphatase/nucleotidase domain-containing protein n=1 Tax=Kalmanozyma brasiliensis (strain GHG001) TaxID=1365824 RepID=V5EVK5_KALBG|nr:Survival protein SurE-like phosphatase/nucleotidase [Kalmanozyma brasiliensis GHG001]EST07298.1 Survival protein SurE-like phosphatase/nucleotidase [Kalmanozyma brasiliensis GHG001]
MKFFPLLTAALVSSAAISATPLQARQASSSSSAAATSTQDSFSSSSSSSGSGSSATSSASASASSATSTSSSGSSTNSSIINSYNSTLSYNSTATANSSDVYGVSAAGFANVKSASNPLNIVLTNDDSWGSANIRALYYALRRAGHRVLMVAPSHNQSGKGGTVVLPASLNITSAGRGGFAPVGAPFAGLNVTDPGLRYFNGTPAACAGWALDHDAQYFFNATSRNDSTAGVDLVVSGPNEGTNLGPFLYTLSGTIGASYFAVERNVPAIAFSASTDVRQYTSLNLSDVDDESVKIATYSANFVSTVADNAKASNSSARVLPLGIGLTVNYPEIAPTGNCTDLEWVHTRLTGKAIIDRFVVNSTTGLPTYANYVSEGVNACLAGNCSLPGETDVVENGNCQASASIYSVDYDAPTNATQDLVAALTSGIQSLNSNGTASNSSANSTSA